MDTIRVTVHSMRSPLMHQHLQPNNVQCTFGPTVYSTPDPYSIQHSCRLTVFSTPEPYSIHYTALLQSYSIEHTWALQYTAHLSPTVYSTLAVLQCTAHLSSGPITLVETVQMYKLAGINCGNLNNVRRCGLGWEITAWLTGGEAAMREWNKHLVFHSGPLRVRLWELGVAERVAVGTVSCGRLGNLREAGWVAGGSVSCGRQCMWVEGVNVSFGRLRICKFPKTSFGTASIKVNSVMNSIKVCLI